MGADASSPQTKRVLLTRSADQSRVLSDLLARQGHECRYLPLFDIEPLTAQLPAGKDEYSGVIFTSRNAVFHGPATDRLPALILAVGPATAAALQKNGAENVIVPQDTRSEGLLALPQLERIAGQRWLIIKGDGGRETLADALQQAGARVDVLTVYRRKPIDHGAATVGPLLAEADAIMVFSGEGLQRLWQLCPAPLRPHLAGLQLVVPSPRVVKMAQDIGFRIPARPARRMSDTDLAAALRAALCPSTENHKGQSPGNHD